MRARSGPERESSTDREMTDYEFAPSSASLDGLEKLGEGRQAEVYAWPGGGVVKLYREPGASKAARWEATAMNVAEASGVPTARLLGTVLVESRPGILMERLDGADQLTILGSKPWRVWSIAATLARLQAQLHAAPGGDGLPPLHEAIGERLSASSQVPEDLRPALLQVLKGLPHGSFVCHGDFHPGNVIETKEGPRVIDWSNVTQGDPAADVARTLLVLRAGELPPGTSFLLRVLTAMFRRLFLWRYLREYRRLRGIDPAAIAAWEPVNVAERLTHGIPEERAYLLQLLRSLVPTDSPG